MIGMSNVPDAIVPGEMLPEISLFGHCLFGAWW